MKLTQYDSVSLIINTLISEEIKLDFLKKEDKYLIEKVVDDTFSKIRKKELLKDPSNTCPKCGCPMFCKFTNDFHNVENCGEPTKAFSYG